MSNSSSVSIEVTNSEVTEKIGAVGATAGSSGKLVQFNFSLPQVPQTPPSQGQSAARSVSRLGR
jgi:hypothetical protein